MSVYVIFTSGSVSDRVQKQQNDGTLRSRSGLSLHPTMQRCILQHQIRFQMIFGNPGQYIS